jgi:DNA-directed RNA polymerase subunit RPC12/RpoP
MTTGAFYGVGTFDTPYPATLQPSASLQGARLFADQQQQQQSSSYPSLDAFPQTPMWTSHQETMVRAFYRPSVFDTLAHHQQQQQHSQFQQQQQPQQQHNLQTLHYTPSHFHHLHQYHQQEMPISAGMSPHFLNDPPLSPPPPPQITSPFTEIDDSASSQGTALSSDNEEYESDEDEKIRGPSTPYFIRESARSNTSISNKKRHIHPKPKSTPVLKHPKRAKHPKSSKPSTYAADKVNKDNKPQGKLHPCKECGRTFTRACNLQSHQTTHLRQKPFQCPDCRLAFARVYDMKRHHRIHSNIRPYRCAHCPEAFKRIEARERHFLARHGRPQKA